MLGKPNINVKKFVEGCLKVFRKALRLADYEGDKRSANEKTN